MNTEDGMKKKERTNKGLSRQPLFRIDERAPRLHSQEAAENTVNMQLFVMTCTPWPEILQNTGC